MRKIVFAALAALFTAASLSAPALAAKKKKAKPGKCGEYMYYVKKTKKCADARAKK